MEPNAVLVAISGPPAAGKTTLARRLAQELRWPLLGKDDLKEILFEHVGWGDRAHSRRLSDAVYGLMFHLAEGELAAGRSVLLEANFRAGAADRLVALSARQDGRLLQVRCRADPEVLRDRLLLRADRRLRHPGHRDDLTRAEIEEWASGKDALDLGSPRLEVDSTDPAGVDPVVVAGWIREHV